MTTYYELLEVPAGASFEEIEASYQRMLGFVGPESLAVYSIMDEEEARAMRSQLDEAFRTLSDPDRRAAYDRVLANGSAGYPSVLVPNQHSDASLSMGHMSTSEPPSFGSMDVDAIFRGGGAAPDDVGALEAPPVQVRSEPRPEPVRETRLEAPRDIRPEAVTSPPVVDLPREAPIKPRSTAPAGVAASNRRRRLTPSPDIEINFDAEFSGAILRRLRESCQATLDEVAEITKISKRYLASIEENDFDGLPASVYVRGFVSEYARVLGLDTQRVAQSYMALYKRYRGEGS